MKVHEPDLFARMFVEGRLGAVPRHAVPEVSLGRVVHAQDVQAAGDQFGRPRRRVRIGRAVRGR